MTIKITGQTFTQREAIKAIGAQWDGVNRQWTLPDSTPEHLLNTVRNLPGISIVMPRGELLMPGKVDAPNPRVVVGRDLGEDPFDFMELGRNQQHPDIDSLIAAYGNDETWLGKFDKKPSVFFGFSDFASMLDFVERIPVEIAQDERRSRNSGWAVGGEWAGSRSMSHAIRLGRNGWSSGAEMAKRALDLLDSEHAQQRRRKSSVAGGRVNVGRMLAGSPDHMTKRARQDGRKIITLLVDTWMASSINAESAIIRAATVAATCDLLESRGYSCEIVAVGSAYDRLRFQVAVNIKQAGDPLNISDVVFALGHPSMLRRLYFALAAFDARMSRFWDSMGYQEASFVDCGLNEFHIGKLLSNLRGRSFEARVRNAFELIVPDNLPVDIRGEDD